MANQSSPPVSEKRIEFLRDVLAAAEKRRDAVENKASIFLATNAILLTAMASLDLSSLITFKSSYGLWLFLILVFVSLGSVAGSSLCAILVLADVPRKLRSFNTPPSGSNLYFFGKIAKFENATEYNIAIQSLTKRQIIEQYTNQAHNLALILRYRYDWYHRAQGMFLLGIFTFIALAIIKTLG